MILKIPVRSIEIGPHTDGHMVRLDTTIETILNEIEIQDVVKHYGEALLDEIGEDKVKKYFDLVTPEDMESN